MTYLWLTNTEGDLEVHVVGLFRVHEDSFLPRHHQILPFHRRRQGLCDVRGRDVNQHGPQRQRDAQSRLVDGLQEDEEQVTVIQPRVKRVVGRVAVGAGEWQEIWSRGCSPITSHPDVVLLHVALCVLALPRDSDVVGR